MVHYYFLMILLSSTSLTMLTPLLITTLLPILMSKNVVAHIPISTLLPTLTLPVGVKHSNIVVNFL